MLEEKNKIKVLKNQLTEIKGKIANKTEELKSCKDLDRQTVIHTDIGELESYIKRLKDSIISMNEESVDNRIDILKNQVTKITEIQETARKMLTSYNRDLETLGSKLSDVNAPAYEICMNLDSGKQKIKHRSKKQPILQDFNSREHCSGDVEKDGAHKRGSLHSFEIP